MKTCSIEHTPLLQEPGIEHTPLLQEPGIEHTPLLQELGIEHTHLLQEQGINMGLYGLIVSGLHLWPQSFFLNFFLCN